MYVPGMHREVFVVFPDEGLLQASRVLVRGPGVSTGLSHHLTAPGI